MAKKHIKILASLTFVIALLLGVINICPLVFAESSGNAVEEVSSEAPETSEVLSEDTAEVSEGVDGVSGDGNAEEEGRLRDVSEMTTDELFEYIMSLSSDELEELYDANPDLDDRTDEFSEEQQQQLAEKFGTSNVNLIAPEFGGDFYTLTFYANGGTFGDGITTNIIWYGYNYQKVTKYSHTDNISDDGTQNSNYGNNEKKTEVVTIDGASSLTVTVTYGGESASYDWVSIFSGTHSDYTAANDYSKADIVQKLGGGSHTSQTKTYTVSGDSVTFAWKSDSSGYGDGYGYYAVITGISGDSTGNYKQATPSDTSKRFLGWSTSSTATEATYAKDGSDIPTDQNLTLYAVYTDFQWIEDWTYEIDGNYIWIYKYNGEETDYTVPASATINGTTYTTKIGYNNYNQAQYSEYVNLNKASLLTGTIQKIDFEKGVVLNSSLAYLFINNTNLIRIDLSNLDTSNVTNMAYMFCDCSSLTDLDVSNWNTSNVTDMQVMFYYCRSLTDLDLSNFNTANVTNMSHMFWGCRSLTDLDVSNFVTDKVTSMSYMFYNCNKLTDLDVSNFVTDKVTSMSYMFYNCSKLTDLDLSNFNTANVTNMSYMFYGCSSLTDLDVSNFVTDKVTSMSYMFDGCSKLTELNLSNFNTSNVTSMSYMFDGCRSLTELDVSNFNTSNVTSMSYMFDGCRSLTELDVSNFVTDKVTSMSYMFSGCRSLTDLDVSNFVTDKVTSMFYMFDGCSALTTIYASSNFKTDNVTSSTDMFYNCVNLPNFDSAYTNKAKAISTTQGGYLTYATKYSITYTANSGAISKTSDSITVATGMSYSVTLPTASRTYYNFKGWYEGNTRVGGSGETVTLTGSNHTLTAQWEKAGYNITYNLSGASMTSQPQTYTQDSETFTIPKPTKDGYRFTGWSEALSITDWTNGFINLSTGAYETSSTYPNAVYSEKFFLKKGVSYTISGTNLGGIRWRAFDADGNYLGSLSTTSTYTPNQDMYVQILLYEGCEEANRNAMKIESDAGTSVTIPKGSTGNREYTAYWTQVYDFTLTNQVKGNMANRYKDFNYALYFEDTAVGNTLETVDASGNEGSLTVDSSKTASVSLKDGESYVVKGLTANEIAAMEAMIDFKSDGYTTTTEKTGSSLSGTISLVVTNAKNAAVPTGAHNDNAMLWMLVIGGLGILGVFLMRKHRKQDC